jgi:hypothetical protein
LETGYTDHHERHCAHSGGFHSGGFHGGLVFEELDSI